MMSHPADETLAAFADGRLSAPEQEAFITHLGECDDCRVIYDAVADIQEAEAEDGEGELAHVVAPPAPVVVRGKFGRKVAGWVAAAAAVAVIFFLPPVQERVAAYRTKGVSRLVTAAGELKQRDVEGRLAGFPHKPLKEVIRGAESVPFDPEKVPIYLAGESIDVDATDSPQKMRAAGLLLLLQGEREAAIEKLEGALKAAGNDDPVLLNDLSAAYLEADQHQVPGAANRALELAERSWQLRKTPEAAWNRALAYQGLEKKREALDAWHEYLKLDSQSEWAAEVRARHLPDLQ
jgi:tetratricopeptide (TPR) repeat protein